MNDKYVVTIEDRDGDKSRHIYTKELGTKVYDTAIDAAKAVYDTYSTNWNFVSPWYETVNASATMSILTESDYEQKDELVFIIFVETEDEFRSNHEWMSVDPCIDPFYDDDDPVIDEYGRGDPDSDWVAVDGCGCVYATGYDLDQLKDNVEHYLADHWDVHHLKGWEVSDSNARCIRDMNDPSIDWYITLKHK